MKNFENNQFSEQDLVPILLVDDRTENLQALEAVLASPGYQLVKANSGTEALLKLLKQDFALILLDVQMPEMDGFETATFIRKREKSKTTPIIFLTAVYGESSHIGQGYLSGAVDYLTKPFDPVILKSKVSVFADLYRKNIEIRLQTEALFRGKVELERVEAIREHYHHLLNWLDHSVIWEATLPEIQFSFVSKRCEQLLGYPHSQWFNEPNFFFKRIPAEDLPTVKEAFRQADEQKTDQRCEHRMLTRDGKIQWFHTGVQVEQTPSKDGFLLRGLTVDITPLKVEEEAIKKNEAKFRRVVESNMLGHLFCRIDGAISDANDYFLGAIGYSRKELVSQKITWQKITPEEYQEADAAAIRELMSTGVCSPYEKEYIRKDGSRISVMIGAALLEGSESDCVCFVLDLTERKLVEEEKNRAIRAREELLEIVSHDLKNPLGAILMNAAMLFRRLPINPDPKLIQKQVERIQRSAEQMKHLIEDLLDLAKVEAGRLILEKSPHSIGALITESIEMFQYASQQKSILLENEISNPSEVVICDRERLLQVFSNLIGNAIKFTPAGGKVKVSARICKTEVLFIVSDSGPGIPKAEIPHIFDRYWQGRPEKKQTLGLGLSIVKGIMESHQGKIWVESEIGHGTQFLFTLPINSYSSSNNLTPTPK